MTTRSDERGLSESVQWAALTPLLMLIVLGMVQGGLLLHARNAVREAAAAGAEVIAVSEPSSGAAQAAASEVAHAAGLSDVQVSVARGGSLATVTVTARAETVLNLGGRVRAQVSMPVERVSTR